MVLLIGVRLDVSSSSSVRALLLKTCSLIASHPVFNTESGGLITLLLVLHQQYLTGREACLHGCLC